MTVEIYSGDHNEDAEQVEAYWCWNDCPHYYDKTNYKTDGCGWYYDSRESYFW